MVGADERAVAGLQEKSRVHKRTKNRVAELGVESPQALRLCGCQPEAGHLDELTLDSAERFFDPCSLRKHGDAPCLASVVPGFPVHFRQKFRRTHICVSADATSPRKAMQGMAGVGRYGRGTGCQSSRSAVTIGSRAARMAGNSPPTKRRRNRVLRSRSSAPRAAALIIGRVSAPALPSSPGSDNPSCRSRTSAAARRPTPRSRPTSAGSPSARA